MIVIRNALDPRDIEAIRALFLEYQALLGIDLSFQHFEDELRALPGDYTSPGGLLFIAESGGETAGCVALRQLQESISCEMKRLYVRPQYRSIGLGGRLADRVITAARSMGYQFIYLDTLPTMVGAQRLYESLGFEDVAPYRTNPIPGSRFLRLAL
jgi:putative acetyltransferase